MNERRLYDAAECEQEQPRQQEKSLLAAVRLIGVRQPDGECEPLLALLPWANEALSREVANALYHMAIKEGKPDPALVEALKSKDAVRRTAAERALGKDGGQFARQAGRRVYPRGLQYPMKRALYVDGKKVLEEEITDVSFFNRFDDAMFSKP